MQLDVQCHAEPVETYY